MMAFFMEKAKEPPLLIVKVVNPKVVVLDSESTPVKTAKNNVSSSSKLRLCKLSLGLVYDN